MAYRSVLPFWFKLLTTPILLWMVVALTYIRHDAAQALWLIRQAALPIAVLASLYVGLVLVVLQFRKVSDAK